MDREENGQFAKGNKGGPGRAPRKLEDRYYEIVRDTVSHDDWEKIIGKAAAQAMKGDSTARKFLADYLVGPPAQRYELSGPGGAPIEVDNMTDDERIVRIIELLNQRGPGRNPEPGNS